MTAFTLEWEEWVVEREYLAHKAKNIHSFTLYRKNLLISVVKQQMFISPYIESPLYVCLSDSLGQLCSLGWLSVTPPNQYVPPYLSTQEKNKSGRLLSVVYVSAQVWHTLDPQTFHWPKQVIGQCQTSRLQKREALMTVLAVTDILFISLTQAIYLCVFTYVISKRFNLMQAPLVFTILWLSDFYNFSVIVSYIYSKLTWEDYFKEELFTLQNSVLLTCVFFQLWDSLLNF